MTLSDLIHDAILQAIDDDAEGAIVISTTATSVDIRRIGQINVTGVILRSAVLLAAKQGVRASDLIRELGLEE